MKNASTYNAGARKVQLAGSEAPIVLRRRVSPVLPNVKFKIVKNAVIL